MSQRNSEIFRCDAFSSLFPSCVRVSGYVAQVSQNSGTTPTGIRFLTGKVLTSICGMDTLCNSVFKFEVLAGCGFRINQQLAFEYIPNRNTSFPFQLLAFLSPPTCSLLFTIASQIWMLVRGDEWRLTCLIYDNLNDSFYALQSMPSCKLKSSVQEQLNIFIVYFGLHEVWNLFLKTKKNWSIISHHIQFITEVIWVAAVWVFVLHVLSVCMHTHKNTTATHLPNTRILLFFFRHKLKVS